MHSFDMLSVPLVGRSLVEASAGTGKTYALSTLLVRLLLEQQLTIDQILVVTFTEAATAELKDRVRRRIHEATLILSRLADTPPGSSSDISSDIGSDIDAKIPADIARDTDPNLAELCRRQEHPAKALTRLHSALNAFDSAGIFTIHGFCHRILQENAFFSGVPFEAELLRDARPLVEEVLLDYWSKTLSGASLLFVERLRQPGKQLTPQTLKSFANWVAQTHGLVVLPEDAPLPSELHTEGFLEAFRKAGQLFDEPAIAELLTSGGLHGNWYRRSSIPEWCAELADFFSSPLVLPQLPDRFEKFTNASLRSAARSGPPPSHPFFDACDELAAQCRDFEEHIDVHVLGFLRGLVEYLKQQIPLRKAQRGLLSFDDLLSQLHDALHSSSGPALAGAVRKRFPAALIDEFQDTDPLQYAIFERIYALPGSSLFLIGDPKQAIYSFRGADVFAYLGAAQSVNADRRYTMSTNYRSDAGLVAATNALFLDSPAPFFIRDIVFPDVGANQHGSSKLKLSNEHSAALPPQPGPRGAVGANTENPSGEVPSAKNPVAKNPVAKDPVAKNPAPLPNPFQLDAGSDSHLPRSLLGAEPLQFRFCQRQTARSSRNAPAGQKPFDWNFKRRELPALVASEVLELLNSGATLDGRRLLPKDFAVLTRTNVEAFDCQRALQRLRIPSVVQGDRSVYEYDEAGELQLILAAVLEPANSRAIRAALTTEMLGLTADRLLGLETDDDSWDEWVERFRQYNQRWAADGFVQMIRRLMQGCGISERLLGLVDGERRMTNLLHLIELLHTAATTSHLGPNGLYQFLAQQRGREFAIKDSEQIRLESDEDAVVLTTIHKAKGLEYPIVICPTLFNGMLVHPGDRNTTKFHDPNDDNQLKLDLGSNQIDEHKEWMKAEAMAENLRLLYVALTRARHRTVVFWGAFRDFQTSALGYLLHSSQFTSDGKPPTIDRCAEYLRYKKDDVLLARLRQLQKACPSIGLTVLQKSDIDARLSSDREYSPEATTTLQLECRRLKRTVDNWQRTASFTELSSHNRTERLTPAEGRDADATVPPHLSAATAETSAETNAETGAETNTETSSGTTAKTAANAAEKTAVERCLLADFPGGASTGNFFHDLLEHHDFRQKEISDETIAASLANHGVSSSPQSKQLLTQPELVDLARQGLDQFLQTPIAKGLRLRNLRPSQRLNEMEFHLPADPSGKRPVSAEDLASAFEANPSDAVPASYSDELRKLSFMPLTGYLKGFIDLVFTHGGRWYVLDYKTNQLGEHYEDYGVDALRGAMAHSHYFLQYHLYSVAVHRYLQQRVAGYDYSQFGGVFYLFLRGMAPQFGSRYGVFFERPPEQRLEALNRLFFSPAQATSQATPGAQA